MALLVLEYPPRLLVVFKYMALLADESCEDEAVTETVKFIVSVMVMTL